MLPQEKTSREVCCVFLTSLPPLLSAAACGEDQGRLAGAQRHDGWEPSEGWRERRWWAQVV